MGSCLVSQVGKQEARDTDRLVPKCKEIQSRASLPWGRGAFLRAMPAATQSWMFTVLPGPYPQTALEPTYIPPVTRGHISGPSFPAREKAMVGADAF